MTGSRTNPALPQRICAITAWRRPTTTQSAAAPPASADSMHQAGPGSRPFVLATLRALRLDPGPYPALPTRRPKASKPLVDNVLTEPRPFRDDKRTQRNRPGSGRSRRAAHDSAVASRGGVVSEPAFADPQIPEDHHARRCTRLADRTRDDFQLLGSADQWPAPQFNHAI